MKVRVISGVVCFILLIGVVLLPPVYLTSAIFIIALIGMHEFYSSLKKGGYNPVSIVGYLSCIPILLIGFSQVFDIIGNKNLINCIAVGVFVIILLLISMIVFRNDEYSIVDISLTVFGIFYVAFLFSFIAFTFNMDSGQTKIREGFFYIWFIFIGAWATDTFAYFSGYFFGKHKIIPIISPKKTWEGSIGGVLGCMVITLIYGLYINEYFFNTDPIEWYHLLIMGSMSGIASQIGDWGASAVKRYVNIKDFGWLIPGHGGILDRFDSILVVAPLVYFYLTIIVLK